MNLHPNRALRAVVWAGTPAFLAMAMAHSWSAEPPVPLRVPGVGFGKPLSSMQHPAGEHVDGVTYLAYQGTHEDPIVCAFHHDGHRWEGPVRAGISALGDDPPPVDPDDIDNHGRPALIVDQLGYIHVFFGGHGGHAGLGPNPLGRHGSGRQAHAVSRRPFDITEWEILENISPFGTYSQVVKMPNGDLYLFFRHGSHMSDWVYQKSTNHGRTFSEPVTVLKEKRQSGSVSTRDTWYAWFREGPESTILSTFNYHPCSKPDHDALRTNAYFMQMDTRDGSWTHAAGDSLPMPLTREAADTHALVFDSQGRGTRLGTCTLDEHGRPLLYFRYHAGPHELIVARWTGEAWSLTPAIRRPLNFQDGDFVARPGQSPILLASLITGSRAEVRRFAADPGQIEWNALPEAPLLSVRDARIALSARVRNAPPGADFLAAPVPRSSHSHLSNVFLIGFNPE